MKIYIGADHNGFELKKQLIGFLQEYGYEVVDEGDTKLDPANDFPQFASRVVMAMKADNDSDSRGILICGSGQGMCMTANRYKGIRASLCWDDAEARAARNDNDSNILCLPASHVTTEQAKSVVHTWLITAFAGATRFKRRIKDMDELGI